MFFKTKDLMTVGNIAGGLAAVGLAMEGMQHIGNPSKVADYVFWSSMCVLIAWTFDLFDGKVARLLKQVNAFGGEFDNVADLVSYSFTPSILLYFAYRSGFAQLPWIEGAPWIQTVVAVTVASVPAVFGCVRFARFNLRKLDVPGYWIGFPRPGSALMIIAMLNCRLFQMWPVMHWVGAVLVLGMGFMNLSLKPWIGHHGRKWSWYLKIVMHTVWVSVFVSAVLGPFMKLLGPDMLGVVGVQPVLPPDLVFDWILIWLACYLFVQWCDIPRETRRAVARLTADWNE